MEHSTPVFQLYLCAWYETKGNFQMYKEDYINLYVNTIKSVVLKNDNTRTYLVSSPTNGVESETEGYIALNPYSSKYGDVHHYDYIFDSWTPTLYPWTRFSSEYGYQSLPSYSTLESVSVPSDLHWLGTKFFSHRQHLSFGYAFLMLQNLYHFSFFSLYNVDHFVYLTQINQAWAIKTQTEYYRKNRNVLTPNGNGLTMGALYWQLNDVWHAPSWSSIEHGGKWKMLHYYTKVMFSPVLVAASSTASEVRVTLISDLLYDIPNTTLVINIYRWSSMNPVTSIEYHRQLKKECAYSALNITYDELYRFAPLCVGKYFEGNRRCFLEFQLLDNNKTSISPNNYLFPSALKSLIDFPEANVTVIVSKTDTPKKVHHVIVKTDNIALFVWLETGYIKGYFSDNGFMLTKMEKEIWFNSKQLIEYDQLQSNLNITTYKHK